MTQGSVQHTVLQEGHDRYYCHLLDGSHVTEHTAVNTETKQQQAITQPFSYSKTFTNISLYIAYYKVDKKRETTK